MTEMKSGSRGPTDSCASTQTTTTDTPIVQESSTKQRRKVISSSGLDGGILRLLLYGAAAGLFFPYLFFDDQMSPSVGMILSHHLVCRLLGTSRGGSFLATSGIAGRKNVLLITLIGMGIVSARTWLIANLCHDWHRSPIILVIFALFRALQWVASGLAQHSWQLNMQRLNHEDSQPLAVSGAPAGAVLSTLVLAIFLWASRGAVHVMGLACPISTFRSPRSHWPVHALLLAESPEFEAARQSGHIKTGVPLKRIFSRYPKQTILSSSITNCCLCKHWQCLSCLTLLALAPWNNSWH